ncbi:MAG TPA: DUF72 domain-containing protein [Acidimicrobiia bacterium]|jgi:uncharacterized protein YecE (DUF72 family)|nr:DUF72 domain-containing protein [Acidimicrobiia bacterium]
MKKSIEALGSDNIRIGTCSWTDPTLTKTDAFYPRERMTAEERLSFYADQFPIVEVDSTYYSPPSEKTAGLWVERTPADFIFDIKAFRLLTQHPTPPAALWKDFREDLPPELSEKRNVYMRDLPRTLQADAVARFREGLMPLHSAGKLGVLLFQMPPFVYPTRGSFGYLKWAAEHLADFQIAVEFRNGRWLDEENQSDTLDFLRRHNLAYVCVDEPQGFKSSVPPVTAATAPIAEIRFHGRNAENWERKGITAAERFRYDYSKKELAEWVPRVRELSDQAETVSVLMNNCYADLGIKSAYLMADLLYGD